MVIAATLALAGAVATNALAIEGPRYDCTFEPGASWHVEEGAFKTDETAPLKFAISKISRKDQTAELTTETGRTDLKVVSAIGALHFIEVTVSGNLTLTTLYGEGDRIPAAHSRHVGIAGQPVGGQRTGFCVRRKS